MTQDDWVEGLATTVVRWRSGRLSIHETFAGAMPPANLSTGEIEARLAKRLRAEPELIELWQVYSYDKRSSPSPYLDELEVGLFDAGRHEVITHSNKTDACADFICREVRHVLEPRSNDQ